MNNVTRWWMLKGIAFVVGFTVLPAGMPAWLFSVSLVTLLIVCIALVYKVAWRQGHSGLFVAPIFKGKIGMEGLALKTNAWESRLLGICLAFFVGLLGGFLWATAS